MEYLTKVHDTDLYIFSFLDYLTILNLKESCRYFYQILQINTFWQKYLYNELIKHNIDPTQLEKYRPMIEPYNISYRNYYVTKSIEQALNDNRLDSIIFLKVYKIKPRKFNVKDACDNCNIKALEFFDEEYGLLPTGYSPSEYTGPTWNNPKGKLIKIKKPKRKKDIPNNEYTFTLIEQASAGASGPPPEPFTCHALPRLHNDNKENEYSYAYDMALERGDIKLLDWFYNKNINPPKYIEAYNYPHESLCWLGIIKERDKLELEIDMDVPPHF